MPLERPLIIYSHTAGDVAPHQLEGFFVGWPKPPAPDTHLELLHRSDLIELAWDSRANRVVGFITALTDGVLSAYIPFLEVLTEYQEMGIGSTLLERMLQRLSSMYMVDLLCDSTLESFYRKHNMAPAFGMMIRNYDRQSGGQ